MKTQIKRFSKSALAVVLTLCMLVSCMTVGIIATDAAQSVDESVGDNKVTFYIYPSDLWSDYASYTIKANANIGDNNTWRQYDFTDTGRTIGGKAVYTVTIYEKYGGVDELQIQKYDGSTWKEQKRPYSSWTTSSTFSGKIYNGSTWTDLPAYDSLVPNITGINGDWSTGNTMTLDSGNNYYYEFTGGGDKYFRFKYNNKYYEAYNGDFDLVNGNGGPYDGSTSAKKYGTRENNNNAFKLPSESGYKYRIYFDTDGKKTWFTKTIISTTFSGVKAAVSPSGAATVSPSSVQNVKSDVGTNVSYSDVDARYSFSKWTASNGTFGSVGGSTETTTASPKFYPTANNATATANFNQKSGKLTLINDTSKGTVAGNATSVTSVQSVTTKNIPAVTVKTGYIFNGWTVTSGTVYGKSGSSTTAYTSGDYIANGAAVNLRDNATITANYTEATYNSLTAVGKYSTNGTSFTSDMPTQPTIAPTSGTYQTGVKVTAPDVDGYQFVTWYTDNGTFGNAADKETMFKPSTNGAQAVARYKKIFTITSSVDSTGTGAGTVSTSVATVEAGGSYTITATAKSSSAIESVKVNGTAKTATASQTISSVSADQTVVVKFKSNVYLKGTMNSTAWAGDVMTANTAGTSYTIANVVLNAGTVYKFKHFVDSGSGVWNNTAPATWTLNGIATHGTKDDGYGSTNLTITPSVKAKVTFVSDGTKFTSITAIPYDSTTYNVTLTQSDDYTITSTYMGVEYTTSGKSANVTVSVYSGTEFSYTVTPASGKYLSAVAQSESVALSPAFVTATHANSYTGTVSSVSKAFAVSATAANTLSITAKSNKSDRGTVQVDAVGGKAYPGQIVKVTVTPKNGVLKSLTVKDASGADVTLRDSAQTSSLNYSQLDVATVTALMYDFFNKSGEALGAAVNDEAVGADTVKYFTMPNSSVTVSATFDPYSAESTWYYNGYDTSGNAVSGYHARQMTEAMVGGEKFSYYHVEGRTGTDQLMTVSNGVPSSDTRYVYFVRPNNYGDGWSASNNPKAHFWKNGGQDYDTWPGTEMSWQRNNDYGQGVYKIAIPDGADRVSFNDATNNGQHQTVDIDLTTTSGAYYVGEWNSTYSKYNYGTWDTGRNDQGWVASGTEYFYQNATHNGDYTGDFNTKGFYNHNTASKKFANPKDLGTNTGDYYINVLYPNTTYTINGVTKTTGTNPMIIWSAEPLAGDDETVKVYAKDGAIRAETFGSTYANIADTKIYAANGTTTVGTKVSGTITNQTYETYKVDKGETIVIKTTIGATDSSNLSNADALKAKYYVRGFCVNGEVSQLLEPNDTGVYTLTYKVPEDYEGKNIEITPIYYLKDTEANPIVTYRVTGFTDALKAVGSGKPGWGDTLYTYPFYGKLGGQNNAFGAYPGQPMVYYEGQYQMQIPQSDTAWDPSGVLADTIAATHVSGVTMSNGYWDSVHKTIMGYGDNSSSADHVQTYDYGDFYKIFNEKKPVDNIVFDFKYRTAKHNLTDIITTNTTASALNTKYGTGGNGFELLTNFHGRNVDLFGTPLSGDAADPTKTTPVYVVSIGGVDENKNIGVENIAGYYATEWVVYGNTSGTTYQRITGGGKNSIPPEVLVLNDDNDTSFSTTTYPSADANHNVTNWKALYTALEAYRGKPVYISYEAADAQQAQGMYYTGTGGATRNDGRWLYSKNGENITSKIKIQYSNDNGVNYTELDTSAPQVTGLSAYFTNDGVEGQMTYSTTIDPDKTFDFEAKTTNANYKFVGWFMEDGTKITTDNASHTERSGSYTFVAKFMQVQGGQLILSHSVDTNDTYKGAGTAKISAVVKDGDEVVRTYDLSTSDITLDDKIIKSDSDYTIEVTLEATATGQDTLGTTVLANPSGQVSTYFNPASTTTEGKTKTIVLNSFTVKSLFSETTQSVKNIIYHSYFNQVKFHYQVTFQYKDRFGETKNYTRQGYLTTAQVANENYVDTSSSTKKLLPAFIQTIAPHVSNFGETITWNFDTSGYAFAVSGNDYNVTATISATQTSTEKRNITFKLPYEHNDGIAVLNGNVGTAAATTKDFALTGDRAVDYKAVPVLPNSGVNGIYTNDKFKNWIAAPAVINDNGTQKYFQYWSIASTSAEDREIERCYFNAFNYAALDNFVVTPKYGTEKTDISQSGIYTGVTYLETSRNQWNDNQKRAKTDRGKAADLLYNDFVINFNYKGAQLNLNGADAADVQELGVVVERIQELDIKQDGTKDTDISKYTGIDKHEDTVKDIINESITDKRYSKHSIAKKDLDNKNSYMLYDAFYNGAGWNLENQKSAQSYTYKNYVYRVYTYIKYTDENGKAQIVLSEVPGYFTMYDEAVKDYVAPKTSSTNP